MNTLQDIMTTPVVTLTPEQTVGYALTLMEQQRLSALVVAQNRKPLGIFTERALIQVRAGGIINSSWSIDQVMSSPPLTARADMDYREAYQLLLQHRFRHLVVIDHQDLLMGIITGTDFLAHLGLEYFMEFKSVGQIMSREIVTLKADSSVLKAVRMMNERHISSLVMEDNGYPIGIITERDLLGLIRSGKSLDSLQLREVMSSPVQTVFADVSSHEAAQIITAKKLRRLVVTNSRGHCVGIVTETDMVKGLRTSYTDHLKGVIRQKDIQLKEVKQQVEEAAILDSMLQSTGDLAITIMDPSLVILLHNHAAEKLYRFTCAPDMVVGSSAAVLFDCQENRQQFFEAVACAETDGRCEFVMIQDIGETSRYLASTVFCIQSAGDGKSGVGLISRDITAQKRSVLELEQKKKEAEDANIALKVMLDQHIKTRESVEEQIAFRLQELVNPYLHLLLQTSLSEKQAEIVQLISGHIESITEQFSPQARSIMLKLSPREQVITDLVRQGKTSKEIANILHIGVRTVETYRNNLRKKLGINRKKISLRTYLITHFMPSDERITRW
jgi:CBS domain-containing protein/DNA-binding CsgD family transcriptional regulator